MRIVLLFSVLCAMVTARCPGPVRCSQGLTTFAGSENLGHFWNGPLEHFSWGNLTESDGEVCLIGFTTDCNIRFLGITANEFGFEDGCQLDTRDNTVYCICADQHYCNMRPEHYYKSALESFRSNSLTMRNACPLPFTLPAAYKTPEPCVVPEPPAPARCPAPMMCSQGVGVQNGQENLAHFLNAEKTGFSWGPLEGAQGEICMIGFTPQCEIRMVAVVKNEFGREKGCQYHEDDKNVYCICTEAWYCNVDANNFVNSAVAAFAHSGVALSCPDLTQQPERYIKADPTCSVMVDLPPPPPPATTAPPTSNKKPDSAGQLNVLMAVTGALVAVV